MSVNVLCVVTFVAFILIFVGFFLHLNVFDNFCWVSGAHFLLMFVLFCFCMCYVLRGHHITPSFFFLQFSFQENLSTRFIRFFQVQMWHVLPPVKYCAFINQVYQTGVTLGVSLCFLICVCRCVSLLITKSWLCIQLDLQPHTWQRWILNGKVSRIVCCGTTKYPITLPSVI